MPAVVIERPGMLTTVQDLGRWGYQHFDVPVGAGRGRPGEAGTPLPLPKGGATVRILWGPQDDAFTRAAREAFLSSRFEITAQSNRMGYRLAGPVLEHETSADLLSEATPLGSIQVPASGQPILLMADRQTTGGYPKIATVIAADVPIVGQLGAGDWVGFAPCAIEEARRVWREMEERLDEEGM